MSDNPDISVNQIYQPQNFVGLGYRLLARAIDAGLFLLIAVPVIKYINVAFYRLMLGQIFFAVIIISYELIMLKRYSGTIGKLFVKILIVQSDRTPIRWRNILLRNVFKISYLIILGSVSLYFVYNMQSEVKDFSMVWIYFNGHKPLLYNVLSNALCGIYLLDGLVLCIHRQKRSIHDIIGGTIVIPKKDIQYYYNQSDSHEY